MVAAYEQAERGSARTIVLEGDAGIGKSRLLSEFLGEVRVRGGLPLVGRCADVEGGLPYGPVVEVLRALRSELAAVPAADEIRPLATLLPELGDAPEEVSQTALFHAIAALVTTHADPLVLCIEDVHWSDRSTREVVRFLHDLSPIARFVIALTFRSDEPEQAPELLKWIGELKRRDRVEVIEVPPFSPDEVAEQIRMITSRPPSDDVAEVVNRRSQGNPFVVEELLAAGIDASPTELPSLADLFRARVATLDESAREVVRAVSVADRGISSDELSATLGDSVPALGDALRAATASHLLVRDRDGRYWFRHALLRDLFYDELTSEERRQYHAGLARALDSAADPDAVLLAQIAHHWREAGNDNETYAASLAAGRAAAYSLAYMEAASHLEEAAELGVRLGMADPPADVLLEEAAAAATSGADWETRARLLQRAIALVDRADAPERAAHLMERLSWGQWFALGEPSISMIEEALTLLPSDRTTPLRARLLRNYGMQLEAVGDERFVQMNQEALEAAKACGDTLELGKTMVQAGTRFVHPDPRMAIDGLELIKKSGPPDDFLSASVDVGNILLFVADLPRLWEVMDEALSVAVESRVQSSWPGIYLLAANAIFYLGRWREAERLDEFFQTSSSTGRHGAMLKLPSSFVAIGRGEFDKAKEVLDDTSYFGKGDVPIEDVGGYTWAVLLYSLWAGEPDRAWSEVLRFVELVEKRPNIPNAPDLYLIALQIAAARAAARALSPEELPVVERLIEGARGCAPDESDPFGKAELDWSEAEYARCRGLDDPEAWRPIAQAWTDLKVPWFEAWTRWRLGESLLVGGGNRADASAELERAARLATELGAGPLLNEIEALAKRARIDLGPPAQNAETCTETVSGADRFGLTTRELEVLRLLAEGKTNPEIADELFISRKTASAHVSHILEKLGVSRRVEAATLAHSAGLLAPAERTTTR